MASSGPSATGSPPSPPSASLLPSAPPVSSSGPSIGSAVKAPATAGAGVMTGEEVIHQLKVHVCTWNVGNKRPSSDLSPWIPKKGGDADIIVVGVQESKYSAKKKASFVAPASAPLPAKEGDAPGAAAMPSIVETEDGDEEGEDEEEATPTPTAGAAAGLLQRHGTSADSEEEDAHIDLATIASTKKKALPPSSQLPAAATPTPKPDERMTISSLAASVALGSAVQTSAAQPTSTPAEPPAVPLTSPGSAKSNETFFSALVSGSLGSYMKNTAALSSGHSAPIFEAIKAHLGEEWTEARSIMMWQTGVLVMVRLRHVDAIDAVVSGTEATGILGVGQNKGGTGVMLRVYGTTLTFMNTHLAAHMKHLEARNANVEEIIDNVRLGIAEDATPSVEARYIDLDYMSNHTFWFGDMNYRVDLAITKGGEKNIDDMPHRTQVLEMIERGEQQALLAADQLHDAIKSKKVLHGFREADITFGPTFKVEREPGIKYKAQRVPSWCDRVLWKSQPALGKDVVCTEYTNHPQLRTSDHKPVSATFTVNCHNFSNARKAGTTRIKLSDVSGSDMLGMDVSGLSDVYLMFYTFPDVLNHKRGVPKSRAKNQTLNPVWQDNEIPELQLFVSGPEDLRHVTLVMVVMDHDTVDADDRMGQCALPLFDMIRNDGPAPFELPVVKAGVQHGTLRGKILLTFPTSALTVHSNTTERALRQCCTFQ